MRFMLFFAALGIVSQGIKLSAANPAASVFQAAAGELGYKFLVLSSGVQRSLRWLVLLLRLFLSGKH